MINVPRLERFNKIEETLIFNEMRLSKGFKSRRNQIIDCNVTAGFFDVIVSCLVFRASFIVLENIGYHATSI